MFAVFKYSSLLSVPLFALIAFLLVRETREFSFKKHTVSDSIRFLSKTSHGYIFRLNFFLKAMLDLSFSLYELQFFGISYASPIAISLILSALFFASLAYFIEGKQSRIHRINVYTSGLLWVTGQLGIIVLYTNPTFAIVSTVMLLLPTMIGFGAFFAKRTTVLIQAVCVILLYFWLVLFVFQYLQ